MSESTRHRLFLAAIASLVFFVNLGGSHLWDVDETIFSQAAAEMHQRGDYVVPYFNGELFPDKPALTYWLMASAYSVLGVGEFGARFWSALLSVGSVLLTHRIGCRLFSPGVGLWAGLILATNISFDIIARAATPDAALIFFTTLAICLFIRCAEHASFKTDKTPSAPLAPRREPDLLIEPTWRNFALAYAAMGVAALAKGPVGVVLPTAVFGLFFLTTRGANTLAGLPAVSAGQGRLAWIAKLLDAAVRTASPRHIFQTILALRPALAVLMVLAVAGPWYVWVGLRTDWQWPAQFFGVHNFGRFFSAMDNHHGPIVYYVGIVLVLFFPWSILMLGSLSELARQSARTMQRRQGAILIACWITVYFGFFSLCSTKLPSYVVPMYPALAIATALFLERWVYFPQSVPRSWPWIAYSLLTLAGLGLVVVVPILAARLLDGGTFSPAALARVAPLGLAGIVPLIGGLLCLFYTWRCQARQSIRTLGLTAVVFTVWLFGFSVGQFDRFQTAPQFIAAIDSHTSGEAHVATFRYFRPSMVFYGHRPVGKLPEAADVASFFADHPTDAFVYTVDEQMPELEKQLPADVVVLKRRPRLFLPGQTLLLGRAPATAANDAPSPR
ncbi:MAG TPA: glycosyltransferase family 39 protein [Pirellulales bacterium]